MKVVLAGAFGHLGSDILRSLVRAGHEVVAADLVTRELEDCKTGFTPVKVDMTSAEALKGLCNGADVVISTVGLTKASATISNYDVDYGANKNLLAEAKRVGVKNFAYVSVLKADKAPDIPMLDAKAKLENELKASGLKWVIFRPTGYFYDIAKVFMPMIEKGKVSLLGKKPVHANVVDTPDFADFIVAHMCDDGKTYDVGGKETYSYEELARMFFAAAGKEPQISYAPAWLFDILAWVNKIRKNGKEAIIKFSKWTLTEEMVGDTIVGDASFAEYIKNCYKK
ncbi:MAG: NAD(P)H-binding protein [Lachnospiraceae bacterium]|nr:NAD(P)H-binding protein [Lachnospiraceae bacterium]